MDGETVSHVLTERSNHEEKWHKGKVNGGITNGPVCMHRRRQHVEVVLVGESRLESSGRTSHTWNGEHLFCYGCVGV